MIESLDDVVRFYESLTDDADLAEFDLRRRADGPIQLSLDDLGLPKNYLDVVSRYDLESVEIFGFVLGQPKGRDLPEYLRFSNGVQKNPNVDDGFVDIASRDGYLILIPRGDTGHADCRVFCKDIGSGYFPEAVQLSKDFETLILVAANIEKLILDWEELNAETNAFDIQSVEKVLQVLDPNLPKAGVKEWKHFASKYV